MENARRLFSANLERGSEILSATAATHALSALCPKFPLFLIERFVNEEAKPISSSMNYFCLVLTHAFRFYFDLEKQFDNKFLILRSLKAAPKMRV